MEQNICKSVKGLISKIYKNSINSLAKKNPQKPNLKMKKKDLNRHFSKEDIQTSNENVPEVFAIANYQGTANQNHREIPPHT